MERFKKMCNHIINQKIIYEQYDSIYNLYVKLILSLEDYIERKESIHPNDEKDKELLNTLRVLQGHFDQTYFRNNLHRL
jgi:hypothetical protein